MLIEYGGLPLAQVLQPAIEMADGYPMEGQTARYIEQQRKQIEQWPDSKRLFFPNPGGKASRASCSASPSWLRPCASW